MTAIPIRTSGLSAVAQGIDPTNDLIPMVDVSNTSMATTGTDLKANPRQLGIRLNVMAFGAKGDGNTNDTTAIQNALNACPSVGGTVVFPVGGYKITSGLTSSTPNIALIGEDAGNGGWAAVGLGAVVIQVPASVVGFTFNSAAASTIFQGPVLRGLCFHDTAGTATGAILIKRANGWIVEDCAAVDFNAGYGLRSDGTGTGNPLSQYPEVRNFLAANCLIGIDNNDTNGLKVIGGYIDAHFNDTTAYAASTTGIRNTIGDTLKVLGTIIQGAAIGVDNQNAGNSQSTVIGCRFEGCFVGVKTAGDYDIISNNTFNASAMGGTATGVSVLSTADGTLIRNNNFVAVSTPVSNAGTNTVWDKGAELHMNTAVIQEYATGALGIYNDVFVMHNLIIGEGYGTPDATAKISLGGAAGPSISQGTGVPSFSAAKGSVYIRLDGSSSSTRLYVNTNGTTGWTNVTTAA